MNETVLIKWSGNWADEMDLEGFCLVTPEEADEIWTRLAGVQDTITEWVGTNEDIDWRNGEQLLKQLTRVDLTEAEVSTLKKALDMTWRLGFGTFPDAAVFEAGLDIE